MKEKKNKLIVQNVIMDTFSAPRYETKIETFDPCIIDVGNQREITSNVVEQTTVHTEENNDNNEPTPMQEDSENSTVQVPSIQSNIQQNMTLTPVRLPAILDGEYYTVIRVDNSNVTVRCLQCQKLLNGNLKSTGNFLSHIKRVHPSLIEKIKTKSHHRKPAVAYVDISAEKTTEIVRPKRGYRKYYRMEENTTNNNEDNCEQVSNNWQETPPVRRRRSEEPETVQETVKVPQNSYVIEDEFDAIGRNVAAKLRNMRLDQRIVAEKLLNDVLFEAQLGTLHRDSNLHV